jgi:predicted DsbA family dithiol-disulfide isomerase
MTQARERGSRPVLVEVWSDIACPWCLIGMRRFDRALAGFEHADEVDVAWRSFQLEPEMPPDTREPEYKHLAAKLGATVAHARAMTEQVKAIAAGEGLAYDFDRAVVTSTFDAHRLAHLGAAHGLGTQMHERLMRARLIEGQVLNDPDVLVRLAAETGVPAQEAREALTTGRYAGDVQRDIREAASLGVTGVPFFVLNRRYAISGAQPAETFSAALRQARQDAHAEASAPSAS